MTTKDMLDVSVREGAAFALSNAVWYSIAAGCARLFFYVLFRRLFRGRRIAAGQAPMPQVGREIYHSLRSLVLFGIVAAGVVYLALTGGTRIYGRISDFGWGWFVASIVLMIVLHDAYFYWTHRLMHHRALYRLFHSTHHLSTSPTPWAAYAFSPWEALVQAGIVPLVVLVMPVHPLAISIFMLWQIGFNVLGHCGYEIYPSWFLRSPAGLFFNSPTHHSLHHEKYRANFGLYFNVWDRLMGTNHPDYTARFEQATGGGISE
jgi:Delta7-sterol 5-desaturase